MRTSFLRLNTTKEEPADAVAINHKLLLRAGLVRMEAAGLYSWLPMGLRVLRKVEAIVRQEMDAIGSLEVSLPIAQPAALWKQSGRWDEYGPELQRFEDRKGRQFCLGPTHEEVICALAREQIKSYRDLPVCYYQIQTKYRSELRPRFGLIRCREFLMKDAYSFHLDAESLEETYQQMRGAYSRIFDRIGLDYRIVKADSGSIGGSQSEEFQVLADSGEDRILLSEGGLYAANTELARAADPEKRTPTNQKLPIETVPTPELRTIEEVCTALQIPPESSLKTLIVKGNQTVAPRGAQGAQEAQGAQGTQGALVALVLRGDHQLNELKAERQPEIAQPLTMASAEDIKTAMHASSGSLGPVNCPIPVLVDIHAAAVDNFCCGANQDDLHYLNANWERDAQWTRICDLRLAVEGDLSPAGDGILKAATGIEVGHIFQLSDRYSSPMSVQVLSPESKNVAPVMGCYGIGVSRILAAAIEQNADEKGIIWPSSIAPFQLAIIPLHSRAQSPETVDLANDLYGKLRDAQIEVLLDDRDIRPGHKLADYELIGIPHALIIGERNLKNGQIEYRHRQTGRVQLLPHNADISELVALLHAPQ
ncbi:MAG: proline--tRNA ligase [Gammaproteobacteria bacterium]